MPQSSAATITTASPERIALLRARPVINTEELLELGPVSRSTVQRAIKTGALPSHTIGRSRLIRTQDALAWLEGGCA